MYIPMKVTLWNWYDFELKQILYLSQHLVNSPRNARYTSKTIQNKIVEVVGKYIHNDIITKVKQAKFYSVIVDKVTDTVKKRRVVTLFTLCP